MTGAGQSREDPCVQTGTKRSSHCNRVISCAITEVSPDLSKQNPYNLVKYSFKLSTWNVLSLESSSSKLYELARVTSEYGTDVLTLTETHRPGTGVVVLENGNLFINSGRMDGVRRQGVGVVLSKRVKNSLISYTPVSERVMWLRLHSKQVNVSVVVAYAPTEDAEDSVKDGFYNEVAGVLDGLPGHDVVFLTGDFNARVGSDSESVSGVVGKHSLHAVSNNNGKRLADLCTLYGLVIGGSLFEHPNIHKGTWKSPDGRTVTQIDHICVSSRWKSSLLDVRSYRGADIGSDHYLVGGRFRLRLRANGRRQGERVAVPNLQKLRDGSKVLEFQATLRNRFDGLAEEVDLEGRWEFFRQTITDTSLEVLGKRPAQKRQCHLSDTTKDLISQRAEAKSKGEAGSEEYGRLRKVAKRSSRQDEQLWADKLAEDLEGAARRGNQRDVWQLTKQIAGKVNSKGVAVRDTSGNLLSEVDQQRGRWAEHFSTLLNPPASPVNLADLGELSGRPCFSELEDSDAAPTVTEISTALKRLKNHKCPGLDGVSNEELKFGSTVLVGPLEALFGEVWESEKVPSDCSPEKRRFISMWKQPRNYP